MTLKDFCWSACMGLGPAGPWFMDQGDPLPGLYMALYFVVIVGVFYTPKVRP